MSELIKIGLVEDQKLFREGLSVILNSKPNFQTVFESPDGFSVIERLSTAPEIPDIMLIDLTLPPNGVEEFNGWEVLKALQKKVYKQNQNLYSFTK